VKTTSKKGPKNAKLRPRSSSLKAANAKLLRENQQLKRERDEGAAQQAATREILRLIASSPMDIQPVLDTMAEYAARLCGADDAVIWRVEGNALSAVAHFGSIPMARELGGLDPIERGGFAGRAVQKARTLHVHDLRDAEAEFPGAKELGIALGVRTALAVPLLRDGKPLGIIHIRRLKVQPFTEQQIRLVETFADQAVIAIENVRLFKELQDRNRDLTETLEQQTATGEVLRVIASSPTELQPVLDTVIANAVKLSGATQGHIRQYDGELLRPVAHYGESPEQVALLRGTARKPDPENLTGRAFLERIPVHILDAQLEPRHPGLALQTWARTMLAVPLLREGTAIGTITIWRNFVALFTERQIDLVQTFADQAVIAIENVRLFQELETRTRELVRTVQELKALGEVGQAVSSTLDLQTVLSTIVRHAVQLSGTDCGIIYEYDEPTQEFHLRASYQMEEELVKAYQATPLRLGQGATGRAAETRVPYQIADLRQEHELATRGMRPILFRLGYQSLLAVPLLFEQKIMGALTIYRRETGSFVPEIVNLLQTFATQSVLAIQNARLFREIEDKSRQIEAANRHSRNFSPTCLMSCAPRSMLLSASLKSWGRECSAS
jgi:two-component system, NtrC family, sensor kinase